MIGGLFRVSTEPQPKWWKALTISGADAGLGFYCPKCHLAYPHSAPAEIRHCGAIESAPKKTDKLPTRQLGNGVGLPYNILPVAWD